MSCPNGRLSDHHQRIKAKFLSIPKPFSKLAASVFFIILPSHYGTKIIIPYAKRNWIVYLLDAINPDVACFGNQVLIEKNNWRLADTQRGNLVCLSYF